MAPVRGNRETLKFEYLYDDYLGWDGSAFGTDEAPREEDEEDQDAAEDVALMGRRAIINTLLGLILLLLTVEIARTWARSLPPLELAVRTRTRPAATAEPAKVDRRKHDGGVEKGGTRPEQASDAMVVAIVEKDVFDPSRQKAAAEVRIEVPKPTDPPKGLTVVGVSIVGKQREAFITDTGQPRIPGQVVPPQPGQQRRLRVGDQIQGYTVRAIDENGVILVSSSGDVVAMTLDLVKGGGGRPAAQTLPTQAVITPIALHPPSGSP